MNKMQIAEKIASSPPRDKESPKESSASSSSDREIFQELKNQRDLIEKIIHQMDKRFDELRQDTNRRFEDTNRRFEEMRQDTNRRFEELRQDMNKRFQQLFWFIGLFIPLCNSLLFIAMS